MARSLASGTGHVDIELRFATARKPTYLELFAPERIGLVFFRPDVGPMKHRDFGFLHGLVCAQACVQLAWLCTKATQGLPPQVDGTDCNAARAEHLRAELAGVALWVVSA